MTQCKEGSQRDGLMLDSSEELYKWFTEQVGTAGLIWLVYLIISLVLMCGSLTRVNPLEQYLLLGNIVGCWFSESEN